jgi:DNA modification methylase
VSGVGWEIRDGDALTRLREIPDRSVQTVITSPPYFGLRDYGTGEWEGGEAGCDHMRSLIPTQPTDPGIRRSTLDGGKRTTTAQAEANSYRDVCGKCGARRTDRQLGLEATPDAFIAALVEVFAEVRRVLRDDGTLWLNMGDSYGQAGGAMNSGVDQQAEFRQRGEDRGYAKGSNFANYGARNARAAATTGAGVKPKDLLLMPAQLALALRADGWCLRSDIILAKVNPIPESVTDRPTSAHEHMFLLTKCRWTGAEQPLPMRDVDAAWLAALVDGEGSICFQDRLSKRAAVSTHSVRLSIVNTNRALLERVAAICGLAGVGSPSPRTRSSGAAGRPVYAWQVTNAKAARVLAAIRPYLIAKAVQADLGLYVQALNRKHTGRGGYSMSRSDQEMKVRAAAACSALNRGEDADLSWFRPPAPGRWVPLPYAYDADAIREGDSGRPSGNGFAGRQEYRLSGGLAVGGTVEQWQPGGGRNKRNVWTVATEPFPGAHFATFGTKWIEPCVLAGSSPKACGECGAPWRRVVEREAIVQTRKQNLGRPRADGYNEQPRAGGQSGLVAAGFGAQFPRRTLGWESSCAHHDDTGRSVILDPFAGSGTTGVVALRHDRSFIGIELNPEYAEMARRRIRDDAPLLNGFAEASVSQ